MTREEVEKQLAPSRLSGLHPPVTQAIPPVVDLKAEPSD